MGLVGTAPVRGEDVSTAAIAKGIRVFSLRVSASDQPPELHWSQLVSKGSAGEGARVAQCYCDDCGFCSVCI